MAKVPVRRRDRVSQKRRNCPRQEKVVAASDVQDRVEIKGIAERVGDHDGPRPWPDG